MPSNPPREVVDAIHAPVTSVTRRIAIYEADGQTPWRPDDDVTGTLVDGSISVDGTRDERRTIDLALDNSSGLLSRDPRNGFWYDKVLKVFRGVEYGTTSRYADVILDESPALYYRMGDAAVTRDLSGRGVHLRRQGFPVAVQPLLRSPDALGATRFTDQESYFTTEVLPSSHPAINSSVWTIEAWVRPLGMGTDDGGVIFGRSTLPQRIQVTNDRHFQVVVRDSSDVTSTATALVAALPGSIYHVAGVSDGAFLRLYVNGDLVATQSWSGLQVSTDEPFTVGGNASGLNQMRGDVAEAIYFPYAMPENSIKRHYVAGLGRDKNRLSWESQVGEFMIDKIDESRFPSQVKVTGRDYTKKCLQAKLPTAMTFPKDTQIEDLVRAMATNAGIKKLLLPRTGIKVGEGADFDQGTERWNVMKKVAEASAYELFFNSEGYLVMRKQLDPSSSASSLTLQTGPAGNLVDWSKSTSDTEIYNRVICVSEGSDSALPFYGEASNRDPNSPTSIDRLGERTWIYTSAFFTSNAQCASTAAQFLKVKGIETFDVNFSSLVFPWTEAGEIIEFLDPDAPLYDPTRFLLSTFTIPLKLGAMSGTAKRIIVVSNLEIDDGP
ncbi:LamG domain-containing protein [Streptomyces wedmorensis]|uniref:LamG domain-containing protein n=1 Tax=Streptomyces wedmorensis TaxID=43759 RepID=UPI00344132C3